MKSPINVIVRFELKPGELETLTALIHDFFEQEVSSFPGFIAAKLHTNEQGTVLINYATWESVDAFKKFGETARNSELSKKIQAFNSRADVVFEIPL